MTARRFNKRLAVFMGTALLVLVFLFGMTFYWQVIAAPKLRAEASQQSRVTKTLPANRGAITDRNGEQLAVSKTMATVTANPKQIKDPAAVAAQLATVMSVSQDDLLAKLTKKTGFVYLARKIDPSIGDRVKALKIEGIEVISEEMRYYPAGSLASQLLGFVGLDNVGLAGVEKEYNTVLAGTAGKMTVVKDLKGNRLATESVQEAVPGADLKLTIDEDIQFEAEKVINEVVTTYHAKKACAIVMDPKTGEILAMANTPGVDANQYGSATDAEQRNSAVVDSYEPGSTFKMVTVAAALEKKLVTPDTKFELGSTITVYDRVVHEAHAVASKRNLTVTQILAQSSNVGAVTIGLQVGKSALVDMIKRFGFTQKLGIDFPGETKGIMPAAERWSGTTIANVPMGQGISVTPLQLATAYSAIANGGVLVQPHLAKDAVKPWSREAVSSTVAAELREMLTVTVEDGTGKRARVAGYEVAGKTGTAQKIDPKTGKYDNNRYVSSFVGMVPAAAPQLVILVTVDEPASAHLGAYVAAPAFSQIASFALKTLGIPPTAQD